MEVREGVEGEEEFVEEDKENVLITLTLWLNVLLGSRILIERSIVRVEVEVEVEVG